MLLVLIHHTNLWGKYVEQRKSYKQNKTNILTNTRVNVRTSAKYMLNFTEIIDSSDSMFE